MWVFELKGKMSDGCKESCVRDISSLISKLIDFDSDTVWSIKQIPNQEVENDGD